MPKFRVTMQRAEYREHTFEMEAPDKATAVENAEEVESCDFDWRNATMYNAQEDVVSVQIVCPHCGKSWGDTSITRCPFCRK